MKIILSLVVLFIIFFSRAWAENITTGDASAKSEVRTEVQGDADVYTKIEVEANGEKKVLETNEPGAHSLEVKSGSNSSVEATSSSGSDELQKTETKAVQIIQRIFEAISNWFKSILS